MTTYEWWQTHLNELNDFQEEMLKASNNFLQESSNYDDDGSNGINPIKLAMMLTDVVQEEHEKFVGALDDFIDNAETKRFSHKIVLRVKNLKK